MNNIDNLLQYQVAENKTPSAQYVLFSRDSILKSYRTGFSDIARQQPADASTTYNAFSVTKTFTAIAILQLAERGLLRLDDPVSTYFPGLTLAGSSTVRQLLAHTAGVPGPVPLSWIHLAGDHESFNGDTYFANIFSGIHKPKSDPGEKFSYSNLGYVLLGQLVAKVSGLPYERYVRDHIITVLGLTPRELGFEIADPAHHAKGYQKRWSFMNLLLGFFIDKQKFMDAPEGPWKPFKNYYVNGAAYGGLIGTPEAFVMYIRALLQPECKLLTNDSRKWMFTENRTNDGKPTGMCLSWYTGMLEGKRYYTHAGGGGGYYCEIRIYPDEGIGSVVFFNRTGVSDERFLDRLDRVYFMERGRGPGG